MIFIHKKSNKKYEILHFGVEEKSLIPVVIYKGEDGAIWTRPASKFFDGRFEQWKDEYPFRTLEVDVLQRKDWPPLTALDLWI